MGREPKDVTLGELSFRVTPFGGRRGYDLFGEVTRAVGPALAQGASGGSRVVGLQRRGSALISTLTRLTAQGPRLALARHLNILLSYFQKTWFVAGYSRRQAACGSRA